MHFRRLKRRIQELAALFLLGALILSCVGCATSPPQYVRELPPEVLMLDCPAPEYDKATNLGLARGITTYHWALAACNNDKAALRQWAEGK